jgi:vacuolar-type H+-ATPase subunit H
MELIKQIKQAEQQAREMVEKAKRGAAEILDNTKQCQQDLQRQAQEQRRIAIQSAVENAELQGGKEAGKQAEQGKVQCESLLGGCRGRLDDLVHKVVAKLWE